MTVSKFRNAASNPLQWFFYLEGSSSDKRKRKEAYEHAEQMLRFSKAGHLDIILGKTFISIVFQDNKTLELFDSHFHYNEPHYWKFLEFRPQEIPHITDDYLQQVRDNLTALAQSHGLNRLIHFSADYQRKLI